MTKRDLIYQICQFDPVAKAELLANYSEEELAEYLRYWEGLREARQLIAFCDA